jgi:hypothetical protein
MRSPIDADDSFVVGVADVSGTAEQPIFVRLNAQPLIVIIKLDFDLYGGVHAGAVPVEGAVKKEAHTFPVEAARVGTDLLLAVCGARLGGRNYHGKADDHSECETQPTHFVHGYPRICEGIGRIDRCVARIATHTGGWKACDSKTLEMKAPGKRQESEL